MSRYEDASRGALIAKLNEVEAGDVALRREIARLGHDMITLRHENKTLAALVQNAEKERAIAVAAEQAARVQRDAVLAERDALRAERHALKDTVERLRNQLDAALSEF